MKKYILVLIFVLATMLAIGCTDNSTEYQEGNAELASSIDEEYSEGVSAAEEDTPSTSEEEEVPVIEIVDSQLQKQEYGGYNVVGTAKAAETLSYAEVKVKFYDKDGSLIETSIDNIEDLEAGETWSFEVIGPLDDSIRVENYKIAVGDCYY